MPYVFERLIHQLPKATPVGRSDPSPPYDLVMQSGSSAATSHSFGIQEIDNSLTAWELQTNQHSVMQRGPDQTHNFVGETQGTAEQPQASTARAHIGIQELARGSRIPPSGVPSPIHNRELQIGKLISESQHLESSDGPHVRFHQVGSGGTRLPLAARSSAFHNPELQVGKTVLATQDIGQSPLARHELSRGTHLTPASLPSPLHNSAVENGSTLERSSSEEPHLQYEFLRGTHIPETGPNHDLLVESGYISPRSQILPRESELPGCTLGTSLIDSSVVYGQDKYGPSSGEDMPRDTKPPPHGPNPGRNREETTDLLDFAAPSTILDLEILETLSGGSPRSLPEDKSKEIYSDSEALDLQEFAALDKDIVDELSGARTASQPEDESKRESSSGSEFNAANDLLQEFAAPSTILDEDLEILHPGQTSVASGRNTASGPDVFSKQQSNGGEPYKSLVRKASHENNGVPVRKTRPIEIPVGCGCMELTDSGLVIGPGLEFLEVKAGFPEKESPGATRLG